MSPFSFVKDGWKAWRTSEYLYIFDEGGINTTFSHVVHMKMAIKLGRNWWWQWRWRWQWQRPCHSHTQYLSCHFLGSLRVLSLPPTYFCSVPIYFSLLCMSPTHTSNFYSTSTHTLHTTHRHRHGHTSACKYQIHLICILHGWVIIVISNEGSLNSGNIIMGHKYLVQFSTHFRYSFFIRLPP